MDTTNELLREPPEDLLTYRPNSVMALLDAEEDVKAAIEELRAAGFPKDEIYVLGGHAGAQRLDPSGKAHGLRGRLLRLLERFGEETRLLEQHAAHMERGGFGLVVPAAEDQAARASKILHRHGAHDVYHLGKGHWESLGDEDAGPPPRPQPD
jgi:hypothetical protein